MLTFLASFADVFYALQVELLILASVYVVLRLLCYLILKGR